MNHDVSVIGLYILDILGRPVSSIPRNSNVEFIDEIRLTVAGTAGGTVVDCAKLGLKALAVGAVGDDEKADFVLHKLETTGIDVSLMQRIQGVPTSATILNIRPNGDRPALHQRGASDHFILDENQVNRALDAHFVHVGGTGLLAGLDGPPTVRLLKEARSRGCVTTLDLIAATRETLAFVEPSLAYVDYFIPSIEEAQAMSGCSDVKTVAEFFLARGVTTCILTLGENGAYVATRDEQFHVPAFEVDVTDTTGCGDAFSAGVIAALKHGWPLRETARFASAAAALVATGLGSDAGITSFEETAKFMESARERRTSM